MWSRRDFRTKWIAAFSVFLVLMPVWMYLRVFEFRYLTVIKDLLLVFGAGWWLIWSIRNQTVSIRAPPTLFLFLFCPIVFLPTLGLDFVVRARPYVQMLLLVAIPIMAIQLDERHVLRVFHAIVLSSMIFAVIALTHYFIDPTLGISERLVDENVFMTRSGESPSAFLGPRLQSITGNPNNLGLMMLMTALISFGFVSDERFSVRQRVPYIAVFGISVLLVMLSRSRSDIGLLVVCLALFILYTRKWHLAALGIGGVLIGLFANLHQIILVFNRLITQGNPRVRLWQTAIDTYGPNLLIGGNDIAALPGAGVIDSSYLQILIELGVVGLAVFLYLCARLLLNLHRSAWNEKQPFIPLVLLTVLIAILGNIVFRTAIHSFPFNLYFWLFFGLGYGYLTDK